MSRNFPPVGEYVGTLCNVVKTTTRNNQPALLIRFAVQDDEKEYAPTAFWSFSENASKYIRHKCKAIGIQYGSLEVVRRQLLNLVGKQFDLCIDDADNGFPQVDFKPVDEMDGADNDDVMRGDGNNTSFGDGYFDFDEDSEQDTGEAVKKPSKRNRDCELITTACPHCQQTLKITVKGT